MTTIEIPRLHIGQPTTRGALSVFPVWAETVRGLRCVTGAQAVLTVEELSPAPRVDQLVVRNPGPLPVLLLQGELLEGGRQHRTAARSVLIGARSAMVVEVACVEQGRWAGGGAHERRGRLAPPRVRAALEQPEVQAAVWNRIGALESEHGSSPTASLLDHAASGEVEADLLVRGLAVLPGQNGVLLGIGGQPAQLELFGDSATLAAHWLPLLRAAAFDALRIPAGATPGRRARRLAGRLAPLRPEATAPAGLALEVRTQSQDLTVRGLAAADRLVHLSVLYRRHPLLAAA